jgi:hypothetical protein
MVGKGSSLMAISVLMRRIVMAPHDAAMNRR